jgi:hypothetical protein
VDDLVLEDNLGVEDDLGIEVASPGGDSCFTVNEHSK